MNDLTHKDLSILNKDIFTLNKEQLKLIQLLDYVYELNELVGLKISAIKEIRSKVYDKIKKLDNK